MKFWIDKPHSYDQYIAFLAAYKAHVGEARYKIQMDDLANFLLVGDTNSSVIVEKHKFHGVSYLKWLNKGEVISGSFATKTVLETLTSGSTTIDAADIDIYLKSKEDAKDFLTLNNISHWHWDFDNPMCAYGAINGEQINLIYGVDYKNPADLIARFDIQACSVAIDPNDDSFYAVQGALRSAFSKEIIFNSVPRGVSVARLVKYINKGFKIEPHQRLFFSELIKTNIYKPELELLTGY